MYTQPSTEEISPKDLQRMEKKWQEMIACKIEEQKLLIRGNTDTAQELDTIRKDIKRFNEDPDIVLYKQYQKGKFLEKLKATETDIRNDLQKNVEAGKKFVKERKGYTQKMVEEQQELKRLNAAIESAQKRAESPSLWQRVKNIGLDNELENLQKIKAACEKSIEELKLLEKRMDSIIASNNDEIKKTIEERFEGTLNKSDKSFDAFFEWKEEQIKEPQKKMIKEYEDLAKAESHIGNKLEKAQTALETQKKHVTPGSTPMMPQHESQTQNVAPSHVPAAPDVTRDVARARKPSTHTP